MTEIKNEVVDISIDLETLGNRARSAIVSIGMTAFNRATMEVHDTFECHISADDALRHLRADGSTLMWWLKQSHAARTALVDNQKTAIKLIDAMLAAHEFINKFNGNGNKVCVWGNGSVFDISLMSDAFEAVLPDAELPWHFRNVRDVRTILEAAATLKDFDYKSVQFVGIAHDALSDSVHQASLIHHCWVALAN